MKYGTHKLNGAHECREAIAAASMHDPVAIKRASGGLRFLDAGGSLLGTLSARHELAKRLESGDQVLICFARSVYGRDDMRPDGSISIHVATGDQGETCVRWTGPERSAPRLYPIGIGGQARFQDAIGACQEGDPVTLYHEADNPHDARAIVVKTAGGSTIGYIPRSSWLQSVVHDDGCGAAAAIKAVQAGPPMAVALEVAVSTDPLDRASYFTVARRDEA